MRLELYWIPLGAGTRVVRISGTLFEVMSALVARRPRCDLFHAALVATTEQGIIAMEMAPTPDTDGRLKRGVVAQGPVGMRWLGLLRVFRYEIRRWPDGVIPDITYAVCSPVPVTEDPNLVRTVLDLVPAVPTPVWGRDELGTGEMWNSNSVISWTLARAGLDPATIVPPNGGRAPGWDAGIRAATTGALPAVVPRSSRRNGSRP